MVTKVCTQCWFEFEARRRNAKFCSNACKQKAHRISKGQKFENKATAKTANERCSCRHCGKGFWQSGKGRKALYCGATCRQMANLAKKGAAFRWYKVQRGISDYEAWCYVETVGTDAIDRIAEAEGFAYSYQQKIYYKPQAWFSLDPATFGIVIA